MTDFIIRRNESLARITDTRWYRTTPGAFQLLAGARVSPDTASFAAQMDTLRSLSGHDFVDLT